MGLFDSLRQIVAPKPAPAPPPARARPSPAAWAALAGALSGDDTAVEAEVRAAVEQPARYLDAFRDRLSQRGIERAEQVEPVIALIDALLARRLAFGLDWKETFDGFFAGCESVLPPQAADSAAFRALRSRPWPKDANFAVSLSELALGLREAGIELFLLDNESDEYNLAPVALDRVDAVRTAIAALENPRVVRQIAA